ncbi:hypothetical protein DOQ73_24440, partial [Salmonella enterica subsp. enterica]|nr:hypothetical protein [Salmonella enterica subsp. enterica serovar Javiana]
MRDGLKAKTYFDEYIVLNQESCVGTIDRIKSGRVIPDSITLAYSSLNDYRYQILVSCYSRGDDVSGLPFQSWLDSFTEYHASRMKEEPCSRLQW